MNEDELVVVLNWLTERECELNTEMYNTKRNDLKAFLALQFASWTADYWRREVEDQLAAARERDEAERAR